MSNSTTNTIESRVSLMVAYYSLVLIVIGTLANLLTCFILCRSSFRDKKAKPIIHYMRTITIFDILMLYGWNLNRYTNTVYKLNLLEYSILSCKFISFTSYFTPQISAWLRVFICLDRYLSSSCYHRTSMNKSKPILIIIVCIITAAFVLNSHILMFVCYQKIDGTISHYAQSYNIYPLWDYVNLVVYNCAPFIFMLTLNCGICYHLIRRRYISSISSLRIQYRTITFILVITTSLFLIMTLPATIGYAFFRNANPTILHFLDAIRFTYHILSFPLYLLTFNEFRCECIRMLKWKICNKNSSPVVVPQEIT
ncbi:unnamed protein product [Rotaria socialis]|uniref:G-protein coupled receptors family 1 profile domain-containing protein n=1 Tax=Rotaria socialis TaxID=392032 RepID=A0A818K6W6_9BILA|nr:unnamed protein product [Rotaria socialis]CAF3551460.1 unnamed protein product [Rotaria socialis]CAF4087123.1 unnamed protein product [Rotaria socialis]CAF4732647.1 unnamed protein product [Rotaria socialis]